MNTHSARSFPVEWNGVFDTTTPCRASTGCPMCYVRASVDFLFGETFPHVVMEPACVQCGRTLTPDERRDVIADFQAFACAYRGRIAHPE